MSAVVVSLPQPSMFRSEQTSSLHAKVASRSSPNLKGEAVANNPLKGKIGIVSFVMGECIGWPKKNHDMKSKVGKQ